MNSLQPQNWFLQLQIYVLQDEYLNWGNFYILLCHSHTGKSKQRTQGLNLGSKGYMKYSGMFIPRGKEVQFYGLGVIGNILLSCIVCEYKFILLHFKLHHMLFWKCLTEQF
jgi:hypothetical protein